MKILQTQGWIFIQAPESKNWIWLANIPKYCNTTPYFLWPEIITGDFLLKSSVNYLIIQRPRLLLWPCPPLGHLARGWEWDEKTDTCSSNHFSSEMMHLCFILLSGTHQNYQTQMWGWQRCVHCSLYIIGLTFPAAHLGRLFFWIIRKCKIN